MRTLFKRTTKLRTGKKKDLRPTSHTTGSSKRADRFLFIVIVFLTAFGILMVYDSSVAIAIRDFADPYYYVKEQLKWLTIGIVALLFLARIDYHILYKLSVPIVICTIALLISVFLPGIGLHVMGARRWIDFGFFVLQPAEFAKLALVIYLSAWFSFKEKDRFSAFLLLVGTVVGLVVLEPDLGTAIIITLIALSLYFVSGAPLRQFAVLIPTLGVCVLLLTVIAPYRMARLTSFLNPDLDPLGSSYQIRQVLLSLGSGGWFGVGVGKSKQKYEYLPEANTDSIFAIIGEEIGFFGSVFIIGLFLFIIWRGFVIAQRAPDMFGRMLSLGIASWTGIQVVINLSAMVALLPLTGVPLPFISYGGSSLIIFLTAYGILLNISKQHRT